jgi:adenine phosphoribosyltransferase
VTQPELPGLISGLLRDVPDFPSAGVLFKDISPLLADPVAFRRCLDALAQAPGAAEAELIAGVEARGFLVAAGLATVLGTGVLPVRKAGKLPPPTLRASYQLEYGRAEIEVPDGLLTGKRVFLVDDVLATGGTLAASADLLGQAGAAVLGLGVLVELAFLSGRDKLTGHPLTALLTL